MFENRSVSIKVCLEISTRRNPILRLSVPVEVLLEDFLNEGLN
jgi:hypothetical protein